MKSAVSNANIRINIVCGFIYERTLWFYAMSRKYNINFEKMKQLLQLTELKSYLCVSNLLLLSDL